MTLTLLPKNGSLVHNVSRNALGDLDVVGLFVEVPLEGAPFGLSYLHGLQTSHASVFLQPSRTSLY